MNPMNGEKWRILTPIILTALTIVSTANFFILRDLQERAKENSRRISLHLEDPNIHYALVRELNWIQKLIYQQAEAQEVKK
jgi:hypothetical protein